MHARDHGRERLEGKCSKLQLMVLSCVILKYNDYVLKIRAKVKWLKREWKMVSNGFVSIS